MPTIKGNCAATRTVNGTDITRWMDEYAAATEKKTYPRVDYKVWKAIKKFSTFNKVNVVIEVDYEKKTFSVNFSTPTQGMVLTQDNGFANFLMDKDFFKVGKIEPITMTTDEINDIINYSKNTGNFCFDSDGNYIPITYGNNKWATVATTGLDDYAFGNAIDDLNKQITDLKKQITDTDKENKTMATPINNNNNIFNFDFGPLRNSNIRMSMYGFAIPNEAGKYVAYDYENERIMDVQVLNFNCEGMFYKVPKALSKIIIGDVVFHNGTPVFVEDIIDESRLLVVDPKDGTEKTIMPARSPFGFDYVTTLVSLMDGFGGDVNPDEENPFGKMLPFLFLSNSNGSNDLLPLMFMANGEKMDFSNPLMLLAMSGGNNFDTSNPLVLMALMKGFNK